jgi:nucleoside-diphosphate-sugar epimerase
LTNKDNIFVTGATGFIGRHLIASLLKDELTVYALTHDDSIVLDGKVNIIKGDITKEVDVPPDTTTIFHCAGIWSDSETPSAKERMEKVNIGGTQSIVEAALRRNCRLIHLATSAVVGQTEGNYIDETIECSPRNFYEHTKCEAEKIVRKGMKMGLKAQILRPTFVFGVGRNPAEDPFLQLVIAIKKGRYRNIGKGKGIYNIIHVSEVVHALRILNTDNIPNGGVYFINTPISFNEFSKIVRSATTRETGEFASIPYPLIFFATGVFALISSITARKMPLTFSRLKTLTNQKVFSQERLLGITAYRPLCSVEEHIMQVCREYGERGCLN